MPADLKKIDIGGGLIHGDAEDFEQDRSKKILLAHKEHPLTKREREIGSNASFGMQDVLIRSARETIVEEACEYLLAYYPDVPRYEVSSFTNYPIESFNAGTIILRKGDRSEYIYLIIRGVVEGLDVKSGKTVRLTAGSLIGEVSGIEGDRSSMTYRTASYIKALRIPLRHYADFVRRNGLLQSILDVRERVEFLQSTSLFAEAMSYQSLYKIARSMVEVSIASGTALSNELDECIFIIASGGAALIADGREIESLSKGEVCGETCMLLHDSGLWNAVTVDDTVGYTIPNDIIAEIPIVRWKLLELLKRRIRKLSSIMKLEWSEVYTIDAGTIDEQHKSLFDLIREAHDAHRSGNGRERELELLEMLVDSVATHFETEEAILSEAQYPDIETHRSFHIESYERLSKLQIRVAESELALDFEQLASLKNWLVNHLLIEDSGLRPYLQ